MKQFLIGCGVAAVLLILLVGGGIAYFAYHSFQGIQRGMAASQRLQALETNAPFVRANAASLDPLRFQSYLDARRMILNQIKSEPLFVAMVNPQASSNTGFVEGLKMGNSIFGASETFAAALEREKMSPSEYFFHMEDAMRALHAMASAGDADATKIWEPIEASSRRFGSGSGFGNNPQNRGPQPDFKRAFEPIDRSAIPPGVWEQLQRNLKDFDGSQFNNNLELHFLEFASSMMLTAPNTTVFVVPSGTTTTLTHP